MDKNVKPVHGQFQFLKVGIHNDKRRVFGNSRAVSDFKFGCDLPKPAGCYARFKLLGKACLLLG